MSSALTDCRTAWAKFFNEHNLDASATKFADGTPIWAWCLHHEVLVEALEEPIEYRINYILATKPSGEQDCRFRNLRPVSTGSIKVRCAARAEYVKVKGSARAEYDKVTSAAMAEYEKVRGPARAEYDKVTSAEYEKVRCAAWAEYDKVRGPARAEYEKVTDLALAEYEKVVDLAHLADVPNHTWDGMSIFDLQV